ncbi:MAG TPA: alpha/beta hydrolase [Usitatibacter sp.]|jgi:pimeloyl-ACP methyl ester carboxylesterase|nr:alpha/beta hydrolase [Usitatibacter sp.]
MAGETVVLLHSSGATPRQWSALAERIPARLRMDVAAPALVGHGSEKPWGPGVAPSLDGEVDRLCARVPHAFGVHLVGHSYGGAVAIKAALSGRLDVRSLTVYEPSLFAMLDRPYAEHESPVSAGREVTRLLAGGRTDDSARLYVDYWTGAGEFDRMPPERRDRIVERMPAVVACFQALFDDESRVADLPRLEMPCLVMKGARSPQPSQDLCEMVAGSMPLARLHHFNTLNHMGPLADPAAVNAVIEEFLWEVATARRTPAQRAA